MGYQQNVALTTLTRCLAHQRIRLDLSIREDRIIDDSNTCVKMTTKYCSDSQSPESDAIASICIDRYCENISINKPVNFCSSVICPKTDAR